MSSGVSAADVRQALTCVLAIATSAQRYQCPKA